MLRYHHYSIRTEQAYCCWITRYIKYYQCKKHPLVVFTKDEVKKMFKQMSGIHLLMVRLLYGCGLRLMECLRLRVLDLDFDRNIIYIRAAKGGKDRTILLPKYLKQDLQEQLAKVKIYHENLTTF